MKRILFSLISIISFGAYSQESNFKFGFQAGLNYSSFRGYDLPSGIESQYSEHAAFAYLAGVNMEFQIKARLSLKVDLNYERKSQQADNIVTIREDYNDFPQTYGFKTKKHCDYITLPILLKYRFTDNNSFYMNGGPFVGYLIKSRMTSDLSIPGIPSGDEDTTKTNKRLDYGISLGFGKNFEIGQNQTIFVEIRENLGLADISEINAFGGNVRTNALNLIVGLSFN